MAEQENGSADRSSAGANRPTISVSSGTPNIIHPTAGIHTQVRSVRGADGHRHYVYGSGGVDGRTARDHASNPHEHQNWQSINGADIICPVATPIYASFDGTIDRRLGVEHGHENDGTDSMHHGNRLTIVGDSNSAYYQHLSSFAPGIAPGTQVHAGQLIGYSGIGGGIAHLHVAFEHGDTDQLLHDATTVIPIEHLNYDPQLPGSGNNDVPIPGPSPDGSATSSADSRAGVRGDGGSLGDNSGPPMSVDPSVVGDHHDAAMGIDPSADHHDAAMSVDPSADHHDAAMSVDPGVADHHDAAMSIDPSADHHDAAMSVDPGVADHHDAAMSVDPGVADHHDAAMSIDPSADHHDAAMSVDPSADHHDAAMSVDPSADHHDAAMSIDPSADHHDAAMSVDPGLADHHDAAMSIDPSADHHDAAMSIDPGVADHHDAAMSVDPSADHHDAAMSVDPGVDHHAATAADQHDVASVAESH